jgi:hypothetical protein
MGKNHAFPIQNGFKEMLRVIAFQLFFRKGHQKDQENQ